MEVVMDHVQTRDRRDRDGNYKTVGASSSNFPCARRPSETPGLGIEDHRILRAAPGGGHERHNKKASDDLNDAHRDPGEVAGRAGAQPQGWNSGVETHLGQQSPAHFENCSC